MLRPVVVALAAFVLGGLCQRAFAEPPLVPTVETGADFAGR